MKRLNVNNYFMSNKKFDVRDYVDKNYKKFLEEYEENMGLNGLDYLWSLDSEKEVDDVFESYE
jgi:hypothetical protein